MGVTNYNSVLTIHVSPEGLHLAVMKIFRLGHPPILIPWAEIHQATFRRFLWTESVVFEVGAPRVARVQLPKQVFAGTPVMIDGQPASSPSPPRP